MNTKLYVGNLPFTATQNDLQDAFAAHGSVISVDIMTERSTGRPRGFAFVTMDTKEAAEAAISALNGASSEMVAATPLVMP